MADEWDEEPTQTDMSEVADTSQQLRNRPCLTVLTGSAVGETFRLPLGIAVIGRAQDTQIRLIDDGVSRHHCRIQLEGDRLWVSDLESRNGTFINGQRIDTRTSLRDGDKIQVGRTTVLRFAYHDKLDESFHENLLSSALRDPLTKLFNKRYFMDRLDSELKFARRHEAAVSLLMLDVDHFKQFNDRHGHLGGDAVLMGIATVLTKTVRNEDVVARFGGEELGVILRAIPLAPAVLLAERLRRTIAQTTVHHNELELRATVSIGIASYPTTDAETIEALIDAADQGLYRAKAAGRNKVSE